MFVSYSQIIDDKQSMYVSSTCFWSRSTFHLICVVGEVLLLLLVNVTYIYNYYHYFRHMNNFSIGMVVKYVSTLLVLYGNDHLQQYAVSFYISKLFWYNLLISHNVEIYFFETPYYSKPINFWPGIHNNIVFSYYDLTNVWFG